MAEKKSGRLVSVDVLRGIAVLAVVVSHLPFSMRSFGTTADGGIFPPQPLPSFMEYGRLGVQLFLVISGFCIHLRWARAADPTARVAFLPFWKRRLVRLYPPYFVALCGALAATYGLHAIVGGAGPGVAASFGYDSTSTFAIDLVLLIFMLQNLTPAAWRMSNGPFWSLALEEQLYLLYFPLLWMRRNWGWTATFAVATAATVGWRAIGAFLFDTPPFFWFLVGPAFWLPWALGAFAVEVYCGHQRLPRWAQMWPSAVVLFVLGMVCNPPAELGLEQFAIGRMLDDLLYAGAFFVLINVAVAAEQRGALTGRFAAILASIGVWSYGIYLVHLLAMVPVKHLLLHFDVPNLLTMGIRFTLGIAVGYLFFRIVEVPFHARARRVKVGFLRDPTPPEES